jgi:hypothetical protein
MRGPWVRRVAVALVLFFLILAADYALIDHLRHTLAYFNVLGAIVISACVLVDAPEHFSKTIDRAVRLARTIIIPILDWLGRYERRRRSKNKSINIAATATAISLIFIGGLCAWWPMKSPNTFEIATLPKIPHDPAPLVAPKLAPSPPVDDHDMQPIRSKKSEHRKEKVIRKRDIIRDAKTFHYEQHERTSDQRILTYDVSDRSVEVPPPLCLLSLPMLFLMGPFVLNDCLNSHAYYEQKTISRADIL